MAAVGEFEFDVGVGRKHAGVAFGARRSTATSPATTKNTGKADRWAAALPRWVARSLVALALVRHFSFFHCKCYCQ